MVWDAGRETAEHEVVFLNSLGHKRQGDSTASLETGRLDELIVNSFHEHEPEKLAQCSVIMMRIITCFTEKQVNLMILLLT